MPSRSDKPSGTTHHGAGRRKTTKDSSPSSPEQPAHRPPSRPRVPRSSKPSFDVARDGAPETRTGWVYRSDVGPADTPPAPVTLPAVVSARPAPRRTEPPQRTERGWIESGLYVMTLPLTLTIRIVLTPVNWMFGARPRS